LTEESIQELKGMIALLDERDLGPQIAGVERKTATEELAEAIAKVYEQFGEAVDPMMRQYRQVNPTFFTEYTNARRIGGRGRADTEAATGEDAQTAGTPETQPATTPSLAPANPSADSAADTEADASEVHAEAEAIRREAATPGMNGQAALPR
jgi:spore germination cell wall hydrolase CwlJ-like protein